MADPKFEELPPYSEIEPSLIHEADLLQSYEKTKFKIGSRRVSSPLVSIDQLKSHLRLLGMFTLVKEKVEALHLDPQFMDTIPPLAKNLSSEERWRWFLELAVERYATVTKGLEMGH